MKDRDSQRHRRIDSTAYKKAELSWNRTGLPWEGDGEGKKALRGTPSLGEKYLVMTGPPLQTVRVDSSAGKKCCFWAVAENGWEKTQIAAK